MDGGRGMPCIIVSFGGNQATLKGEFDGTRESPKQIAHSCIEDKRDRSFRGISAGKTKASGVRGERSSTAWRLPGGRRSHDTRRVRRRIPLAMPLASFVVLSPHNQNFTALAVCILHCIERYDESRKLFLSRERRPASRNPI